MIEVGARAPEFEALREDGRTVRLSEYRGKPVVLYFFPRAMTPGCTRETEGFVERYPEFSDRGVAILGISVDSVDRQRQFAVQCATPFPLVSDSDRTIARSYGVLGILGMAKRVTFLLGADGVVVEVIAGMLPGPHVRGAVDRLLVDGAQRP